MGFRIILILSALVLAAVLEITVLRLIAFHPASGVVDPSSTFQYLASWAALPLVVCGITAVAISRRFSQEKSPVMPLPVSLPWASLHNASG